MGYTLCGALQQTSKTAEQSCKNNNEFAIQYTWYIEAINALVWEPLETRRAKSKVKQMYKVLNDLAPSSLATLFVRKRNIAEYDLRGSSTSLELPLPKTENLKKSFCYDGAKLWNSLPADMRDSDTLPTFINAIDAYNF